MSKTSLLTSLLASTVVFCATDAHAFLAAQNVKSKNSAAPIEEDLNVSFCKPAHGAGLEVDFLWWSTNYNFPVGATGQSIKGPQVTIQPNVTEEMDTLTQTSVIRVDNNWNPGVRTTLIMDPWDSDIDFKVSWTYYHNKSKINQTSSINIFFGTFDSVKASLSLNYNVGDFEIGKSFYTQGNIMVRPFAGVRFAWLDQGHKVFLNGTETNNVSPSAGGPATVAVQTPTPWSINYDQRLWSVGPRIGLDSSWFKFWGLSLMGNISSSLLYGRTKQKLKFDAVTTKTNSGGSSSTLQISETKGSFPDKYWQLFPTLQLFLGLSWERCFEKHRSVKLFAGWETNFLWETQNIIYFDRAISMQGLTTGIQGNF